MHDNIFFLSLNYRAEENDSSKRDKMRILSCILIRLNMLCELFGQSFLLAPTLDIRMLLQWINKYSHFIPSYFDNRHLVWICAYSANDITYIFLSFIIFVYWANNALYSLTFFSSKTHCTTRSHLRQIIATQKKHIFLYSLKKGTKSKSPCRDFLMNWLIAIKRYKWTGLVS